MGTFWVFFRGCYQARGRCPQRLVTGGQVGTLGDQDSRKTIILEREGVRGREGKREKG